MPVRVLREPMTRTELEVDQAFIRWANHPRLTSTAEVNAVFRSVPSEWAQRDWVGHVPLENLEADRKMARKWIADIMRNDRKRVTALVGVINGLLDKWVAGAKPKLEPETLRLRYDSPVPGGVQGVMVLGAALILSKGFTDRIRQCNYKGNKALRVGPCKNFVFTPPARGRPAVFCSDKHRKAQEVVRVSRYRL